MKTDISREIYKEIEGLISKLVSEYKDDTKQIDEMYIEMSTEMRERSIGLVFYPKLLTYGNGGSRGNGPKVVPWICVRMEFEDGDQATEDIRDILKWIIERFKKISYSPFKDEDASHGYFTKETRRGWTKYSMYVNPDFPEGQWENHTL